MVNKGFSLNFWVQTRSRKTSSRKEFVGILNCLKSLRNSFTYNNSTLQEKMPPLCQFPIYTRDGEIFVDTVLIQKEVELTQAQKEEVLTFHNYTFSQVLRLEKFPMQYKPNEANSNVLVVPLTNTNGFEVAWNFLETIDYDR